MPANITSRMKRDSPRSGNPVIQTKHGAYASRVCKSSSLCKSCSLSISCSCATTPMHTMPDTTMLEKINYFLWCTTSANQLAGHKLWCPAREARRKKYDFGVSGNTEKAEILSIPYPG
jgi:hypothetical protein